MSLWNNPPYYLTAYGLAVKHGFTGTEEQWLASLKGEPGLDLMVVDTFETYAEMIEYYSSTKPDGFVMVGTTTDYLLYYWDAVDQEWYSINLQGRDGETGAAATVAVGTVTTLNPGSDATVENSGTEHAAVFDFGIPKGEAGVSMTGFQLVSGTHAAGTFDTYHVILSNGVRIPVIIYNGADGLGAGDMMKYIYDPRNRNTDVFQAIADAVAASVTSVNGETGDVTLNHVALANNLYSADNQEIYDGYAFRTSGGTVSIDNGEANLTAIYGNTEAAGRVPESLKFVGSIPGLYPSIDAAAWRASDLGGSSGVYVFLYDTDHWAYGDDAVNLSDYGITVIGTPADGNTITVSYTKEVRGTLVTATPTSFQAIGLNQFDKANNILADYSIDTSGNVVANPGTYVAFIHAVGGLDDGYTVYSSNNAVLRIGLCGTMPDSGTTGIEIVASSTGTSYVTPDEDGYICVVCTDIDTLCVHPTWSGYEDTTYESYQEDSVAIPTADADGTSLPTASYGMPSVGSVRDELSFDMKTYTQRIARLAYSAANLETVQAMGVDYDYDAANIFYVLDSPVVYSLAGTVSGAYTVADFGTEEFLGTSVKLYAQNVYGANLRDKLRTDVVTISAQTLTDSEKGQVCTNIGAARSPLRFTDTVVGTDSTVSASVSGDITGASVTKATFETQITTAGSYVFSYDGADWSLSGTTVDLTDYGITVEGTAASGDEVTVVYTEYVPAFVSDLSYADFPYRAAVALTGVTADMVPEVVFGVDDATSGLFAPVAEAYAGGVYLYASGVPEAAITIPTILCWR